MGIDFRFYNTLDELSKLLTEGYKWHLEGVGGLNGKRCESFYANSYYVASCSHDVAGTISAEFHVV